MKVLSIICAILLFNSLIIQAQTDSIDLNIQLSTVEMTLHEFEIKPIQCFDYDLNNDLEASIFRSLNHRLSFPFPEKQYFIEEITENKYILSFGDNYGEIKNLTQVVLISYESSEITAESLFQKDFLKAKFNIEQDFFAEIKNVGKTLLGNQESYWLKMDIIDDLGISKSIMLYLTNPATQKCLTIMISTYSDIEVEEKLCTRLKYIRKIQWD